MPPLNAQFAAELPPIYGNAGKLQQVFMNLLLNAVESMGQDGELRLSTLVREDDSDNKILQVVISDTGPGIPVVASR